jgi:hypothetical protein
VKNGYLYLFTTSLPHESSPPQSSKDCQTGLPGIGGEPGRPVYRESVVKRLRCTHNSGSTMVLPLAIGCVHDCGRKKSASVKNFYLYHIKWPMLKQVLQTSFIAIEMLWNFLKITNLRQLQEKHRFRFRLAVIFRHTRCDFLPQKQLCHVHCVLRRSASYMKFVWQKLKNLTHILINKNC